MSGVVFSGRASGRHRLSWDDIAALPGTLEQIPLAAAGAVGAAVPAAALVEIAQPDDDAAFCTVISTDGDYRASIPLSDLLEGGWVAFQADGRPLPASKGGPLRLIVAKGRTLCWNVKDVGELRFTAAKQPDSVPPRPKH